MLESHIGLELSSPWPLSPCFYFRIHLVTIWSWCFCVICGGFLGCAHRICWMDWIEDENSSLGFFFVGIEWRCLVKSQYLTTPKLLDNLTSTVLPSTSIAKTSPSSCTTPVFPLYAYIHEKNAFQIIVIALRGVIRHWHPNGSRSEMNRSSSFFLGKIVLYLITFGLFRCFRPR